MYIYTLGNQLKKTNFKTKYTQLYMCISLKMNYMNMLNYSYQTNKSDPIFSWHVGCLISIEAASNAFSGHEGAK